MTSRPRVNTREYCVRVADPTQRRAAAETWTRRYHAWESLAMGYLSKLSPKSIREDDNSFNRLVREYVPGAEAVSAEAEVGWRKSLISQVHRTRGR
jgi:hypothetical protein